MDDVDVERLRLRIAHLEEENAGLKRAGSAEAGPARDAARIVEEIRGTDRGTDPFAAAVRATRMPMVISNPRLHDNPIVFVNDAFCRLTGYEREEILGRNCRFLQGAETEPGSVASIRDAIEQRRSVRIDILNYRKGGQTFWNRLLMAPVRDAAGDLAYFFASQVDVTLEREHLEGLESHNAALVAEVTNRLSREEENIARLNFAAEAGSLGIWERDLRSGALTTSAITRANFGRDRAYPFSDAELDASIHPADQALRRATQARSLESDAPYDVECRVIGPDGVLRWIQMRAQVIRSAKGVPLRLAGICLDITARKLEDTWRSAMVELSDRIRDLDDPDELAAAAAEILGRALGVDRVGYGSADLGADAMRVAWSWCAAGPGNGAGTARLDGDLPFTRSLRRGESVAVADVAADPRTSAHAGDIGARALFGVPSADGAGPGGPVLVAADAVRHWRDEEIGFVRDVAERTHIAIGRRRAELSLRSLTLSLERQVVERTTDRNRLWDLTTDLIVVADLDTTVAAVNPAWTAVLGWDEADIVGRKLTQLMHPEDLAPALSNLEALGRGVTLRGSETRYRHRDGHHRWISWTVVPDGGLIVGAGRDVTAERERAEALRQAEDHLRQSQKMEAVGQLTGGLAHDFNNLLAGISGSLELLAIRVRQGRTDQLDRYVTAAQGAAKRAAALTHRLLAFSRRQTLEPRPTDVNRLVGDMEELIRRTVGPAIAVEVVGAPGLWAALVDPNQLENALLNLAINARDAMPDGGRLVIETDNHRSDGRSAPDRDLPAGDYLSLCVSDTGAGMSPEVVARAFDPFFTTKPIGQGTGLGLSMIYGFARQSGGQVAIASEVGIGTRVSITLPRHDGEDRAAALADPGAGDAGRAMEGETVLVVDDEPTVRMLVADVLSDLGYAAIEAEDGPAGLRVLASTARIDLLVTDVGLPGGLNGRQVADAARLLRPGLNVLFITGYAESAVAGGCQLDPGMEVLSKPFSIDELAARIRRLIS